MTDRSVQSAASEPVAGDGNTMAAKRADVSKKLSFEVFKRDGSRCEYCGAAAPDVLLVLDHVKPIAEGGTNDILNPVTSCDPCNNGIRIRHTAYKTDCLPK